MIAEPAEQEFNIGDLVRMLDPERDHCFPGPISRSESDIGEIQWPGLHRATGRYCIRPLGHPAKADFHERYPRDLEAIPPMSMADRRRVQDNQRKKFKRNLKRASEAPGAKGFPTYMQERFQQSNPFMAAHEVLKVQEARNLLQAAYQVLKTQKAQEAQAAEQTGYIHMGSELGADPFLYRHQREHREHCSQGGGRNEDIRLAWGGCPPPPPPGGCPPPPPPGAVQLRLGGRSTPPLPREQCGFASGGVYPHPPGAASAALHGGFYPPRPPEQFWVGWGWGGGPTVALEMRQAKRPAR